MKDKQPKFHVANGYLCGPDGNWRLSSITAVYKREGGKLNLKKWLIMVGGSAGGVVLASANPLGAVVLGLGSIGYGFSGTMRVYVLVEGKEIELLAVPFCDDPILGFVLKKEAAEKACHDLVSLIQGFLATS